MAFQATTRTGKPFPEDFLSNCLDKCVHLFYLFADPPNPQRKILEELNLRKQLLKSGTAQTLNPSALNTPIGVPALNSNPVSTDNQMSTIARAALHNANTTSFGYFIPQESAFGNNILAVLPRCSESK